MERALVRLVVCWRLGPSVDPLPRASVVTCTYGGGALKPQACPRRCRWGPQRQPRPEQRLS